MLILALFSAIWGFFEWLPTERLEERNRRRFEARWAKRVAAYEASKKR